MAKKTHFVKRSHGICRSLVDAVVCPVRGVFAVVISYGLLTASDFLAIAGNMTLKMFQKRVENFACGHCFTFVRGNGYTNHCPKCLWSRHVDIHPGDRRSKCRGLMEPIVALLDHGEWDVMHRCVICGHEKKNRLSDEDDRTVLAKLLGRK